MLERFTASARNAVYEASTQARRMPSDHVGPEHLLLALVAQGSPVLASAGFNVERVRAVIVASGTDTADADALRAIGIDLQAVKDAVSEHFGADAWARAARPRRRTLLGRARLNPFSAPARRTLAFSVRAAVARRDRRIADEHLILGITQDPSELVVRIVEDRVPVAELRSRAATALDQADAA